MDVSLPHLQFFASPLDFHAMHGYYCHNDFKQGKTHTFQATSPWKCHKCTVRGLLPIRNALPASVWINKYMSIVVSGCAIGHGRVGRGVEWDRAGARLETHSCASFNRLHPKVGFRHAPMWLQKKCRQHETSTIKALPGTYLPECSHGVWQKNI